MKKIGSLTLLISGVMLIIIGISATNSFNSDIFRFFTGSPTNKAVWLLMGGMLAGAIGLAGVLRSPRTD